MTCRSYEISVSSHPHLPCGQDLGQQQSVGFRELLNKKTVQQTSKVCRTVILSLLSPANILLAGVGLLGRLDSFNFEIYRYHITDHQTAVIEYLAETDIEVLTVDFGLG